MLSDEAIIRASEIAGLVVAGLRLAMIARAAYSYRVFEAITSIDVRTDGIESVPTTSGSRRGLSPASLPC